ncbi:MAG: aquaporin [Candidatus Saccharimonadales bacterium]
MFNKNKLAMLVGEFLGTGALALAVLSVSKSIGYPFFVSFAAGLVVLLMTLALAGISGAIFNPAMTIGLWTVRKLKTLQALMYLAAQLLGGAAAYWLFVYFTKAHLTNNHHYDSHVLVAESVGAFVFAFGWAAAVYQRFSLYAKAAAIGGSLTAGVIIASLGSNGFLNPAVALAARNWAWGTYVLGPVLGAIVGFNLYNLLFVETELAEAKVARASASKAVKAKPAAKKKAPAKKRK